MVLGMSTLCGLTLKILNGCNNHNIQWIHLKTIMTLKNCASSSILEDLRKSFKIMSNHVYCLLLAVDWLELDNLIGPSGLLFVVSHQFALIDSNFSFIGRVGIK
jgi:hypothetical protein